MSLRVLLVEDEDDARELLGRAFERAGHVCLRARTTAEAELVLAQAPGVDAAVIDVMLAGDARTGLDLLAPLREAAPAAPVVVMTAFADLGVVRRALNEGASYLLDKPFRADELLGLVLRLVAERRAQFAITVEVALGQAGLTDKERAIARLLLKGLPTAEVARLEGNSDKTIRQHVSAIYAKCGVSSRAEFFHYVFPS